MAKPRIILADTDINYIIPLQLKFVEEFFEKVDLEIISDESFFDTLFSSPQRADILVVSEDLYDSSLQRHNLSNIFLMTEQYEEDQTDELNVNRIFKYTSIKEIFNEITGKSADSLKIKVTTKEPQIILVCSACGGTGKTTVALGMSGSLTKNYKKVLYLCASNLQTFQRMMKNPSPIAATDVYAKLTAPDENIYSSIKHIIRKETFSYVPPFKASLLSLGIEYSAYGKVAESAKKSGEYDFIIIDAESSFNDDMTKLIDIADKVIIVTGQSMNSVYATNALVNNINGSASDKYAFVCNNFDKGADNALISPEISLKFNVVEYIEKMDHYDVLKCDDISNSNGIQKTAFLIL